MCNYRDGACESPIFQRGEEDYLYVWLSLLLRFLWRTKRKRMATIQIRYFAGFPCFTQSRHFYQFYGNWPAASTNLNMFTLLNVSRDKVS